LKKFLIECCVESYDEALSAEKKGADQIELCSDLNNDGLTPEFKLVKKVINNISIPIKIMVRPRKGNFCYSNSEMVTIKDQITYLKSLGVDHIVFGVLDKKNNVNIDHVKKISDWSSPMKITFHKAIDESIHFFNNIEDLVHTKRVDSLLTSGQSSTAKAGARNIKKAINIYGKDIKIISAGKITSKNLDSLHKKIGGNYYHGREILGKLC
tara:strand:+ start:2594 stop:3226 length:633 start_codon:yes stop_codon:yes gene_type:complete